MRINLYFSFSCLSCFLLVKAANHAYSNPLSASTSKGPTLRVPCFRQRKLKLFMVCVSMHGNGRSLSPQPVNASQAQSSGLSFTAWLRGLMCGTFQFYYRCLCYLRINWFGSVFYAVWLVDIGSTQTSNKQALEAAFLREGGRETGARSHDLQI